MFVRTFKFTSEKLREYASDYRSNFGYPVGARERPRQSQWHSQAYLELWMEKSPGQPLIRFKAYPVCKYSGKLGPKKRQGDLQTPEGFYGFGRGLFNPNSDYRLAVNIGYPNRHDQILRYTGGDIMIHGDCASIGCFAMERYIDEIYTILEAAANGGQATIPVHSFPFHMNQENMDLATGSFPDLAAWWNEIKPGYDAFESTRRVPSVTSGRTYSITRVGSPVPAGFDDRSKLPVESFDDSWDGSGLREFPPKGSCADGAVWVSDERGCVRMSLQERNDFRTRQRREREERERASSASSPSAGASPNPSTPTTPRQEPARVGMTATARNNYSARSGTQLSVRRGERITVVPMSGAGPSEYWTYVENASGQRGFVPSSNVIF